MEDLNLLRGIVRLEPGEYSHLTPDQKREANRILRSFVKEAVISAGIPISGNASVKTSAYRYSNTEDETDIHIKIGIPIKVRDRNWGNGTISVSPTMQLRKGAWATTSKISDSVYVWPSGQPQERSFVEFGKGICDTIYRVFGIYTDKQH
jgi:hypothetical protein